MSGITNGVKDFFKSSNKPDSTEVCSEVAPEVVQEHVIPQERVETVEAIDRERHIHHHQHRVQPINDAQTLETSHIIQTAPEVLREHKEDMLPEHQQKLHEQRTQYANQQVVDDVQRTQANLGTQVNTHEHHHIHETIQPVIQRETVQPTVIHNTVGVHERLHEAPIVHEMTELPAMTQAEFLKQKESNGPMAHGDKGHTHQFYEGAPRVGGGGSRQETTQAV